MLNSIRLNLKAVMLFLFAGEMIASQDGLAFRIALLRRHMGMNVIIPYVLWVALLLFLVDLAMRVLNANCIPGFRKHERMMTTDPSSTDICGRVSDARVSRPRRCSSTSI